MNPIVAAALLSFAVVVKAQDQPLPDRFRGDWSGEKRQAFASVSETDPNALECVEQMETPQRFTVSDDGYYVTLGATDAIMRRMGATTLIIPAAAERTFTATRYDEDIAYLREQSDNTIKAFNMYRDGGNLVFRELGGAQFTYADQSNKDTYNDVQNEADVNKEEAACVEAGGGSKAPAKSLTLFVGDGGGVGSGASAPILTIGAAAVALAATIAL